MFSHIIMCRTLWKKSIRGVLQEKTRTKKSIITTLRLVYHFVTLFCILELDKKNHAQFLLQHPLAVPSLGWFQQLVFLWNSSLNSAAYKCALDYILESRWDLF